MEDDLKALGMTPISSQTSRKKYDNGLAGFAEELYEREKIKTETMDERYLTLENLIQDIHNNPPILPKGEGLPEVIRTREHRHYGLLPLIAIRSKNGGDDGDIKKVIFGLRYTEENSNEFRKINGLGIAFKEEILPHENLSKNVEREYVLLNKSQFEDLKRLTYSGEEKNQGEIAKGHREERLDILDDKATATETYKALIKSAIKHNASDIHIEPYAHGEIRIRFRKDGVLQKQNYKGITEEKRIQLIQVIKGQAKATMDVSQKRKPQDGHISIKTKESRKENPEDIVIDLDSKENYNLRVSLVNTNHGEKAVLRILKSQERAFKLDELGFPKRTYNKIKDLIQSPNGIVILAGPTGSGKTTSLYAMLEEKNTDEVNISTVEDPVEMDLAGINQLQLNEKAGITFPICLRALLRQDPDIMLVGEIRDKETAVIAAQAAKTGHLVFSTLHTRDSIDTLLRMQDFNIENRDLATIIGVASQRLVRKLCKGCRQEYSGRKEINDLFGEEIIKESTRFYKPPESGDGKTCKDCGGIGYSGRIVIPELWIIGNEEREMIERGENRHQEYLKLALKKGMWDLTYQGLRRVRGGHTSLAELFRVAINKYDFLEKKEYIKKIIPEINKERKERSKKKKS